jgi:hypothetical protein
MATARNMLEWRKYLRITSICKIQYMITWYMHTLTICSRSSVRNWTLFNQWTHSQFSLKSAQYLQKPTTGPCTEPVRLSSQLHIILLRYISPSVWRLGYWLEVWGIGVRFRTVERNDSLLHCVQTSTGNQPASNPRNRDSFLRSERLKREAD